jgi:hypothetical protein
MGPFMLHEPPGNRELLGCSMGCTPTEVVPKVIVQGYVTHQDRLHCCWESDGQLKLNLVTPDTWCGCGLMMFPLKHSGSGQKLDWHGEPDRRSSLGCSEKLRHCLCSNGYAIQQSVERTLQTSQ